MPLAYYAQLSRRDQALYRKSDRVRVLPLPDPGALGLLVKAVQLGLTRDDVRATQKASHRLVGGVCEQLGAPPVTVRVLARRPHDDESELHGLYEAEEGRRPVIRAWMRTAVHQRPVAHRSFLRTLMHEVCHHVDFELFGYRESFHTEGFFAREAHLTRQLLGPSAPRQKAPRPPETSLSPAGQLPLFAAPLVPAPRRGLSQPRGRGPRSRQG